MVDGGWSGLGLDHDIDTFLGDIEACSSVTRTKRGYFLKEALRASGKAPQAFFATSSTRVRRGFNRSGFSAITPTLQSRAKEQMEYTEQHSYQTLTVDGFVFHTPSEHSKSNPTSSFLGEVVHATPTRSRVLEDLGRLHNSGDLVLQRRSVFAQHGRDRLFAELRKANYPEASISELESLPTQELRDVVYTSLNTIHLGYYFDHAALLETWPTAICYARIMYLDRQWNPATELSHKKKLLQNLMRPTIDLFGRGHSSQEETNDLLTLVTSEFWPTDGYFLQPPSPSLSMEDVANLTAPPTDIEEAAIGDGSSDVEVWFKSKFSIGDIEQHLTNMGQQGSGGMYSSPHRYGSQEELVIPAACLLLDSRVLGDHIDLFGGGPGGNSKGTFNTDSGVKMAEWRRQYCVRFSSDTPADGKIVVAAVKKDLQGVVMRSGVAPPASKGSAADFEGTCV
uniref:Uncharacterized protein n=1 Tax=Octactis speculum TaxID=3111310 RepID=A0A7S2GQC9_9STRA